MDFLMQIITYPAEWFKIIIQKSGTVIIFFSIITVILLFRYIIKPLTGTNTDSGHIIRNVKERNKKE